MTLVLKLDLDMVKILYHTKNEVSMSKHSKVLAQADRHEDRHRQYENITFPHMRAVKIQKFVHIGCFYTFNSDRPTLIGDSERHAVATFEDYS